MSIPIANETPYTLTDAMRQDILHDAQEHFGGRDADAQEDDVFTLDKPVEEDDEDEEEGLLDEEDEE